MAERDEAHAALATTRAMANETNAAIRAVVLDALGVEDDGKTPLIEQVRNLIAVQRGLIAAAVDAHREAAETPTTQGAPE